jgi:tripartite-type tricarboxylate transporter receptor subunit TctC
MKTLWLAFSTLLVTVPAHAQAAEDVGAFFKGKVVRIIVGVAAGSGYDINARAFARRFGAHIPGNPTVIVQNQPGAGSITMTHSLYKNGPFDGTAIGASFGGLPTTVLLQPGPPPFDPVKLNWIGSTNRETHVTYVWHTAPDQSFADVYKKELVVGAQAPGTTQFDFPMIANSILGTKFRVVSGYEGTPQIHSAMEAGEIQGNGATAWTSLKALKSNWLAEKKIKVIAQWSLRKNPELPDVPSVYEAAKSEPDKQALRLVMARLETGRPFFLPPNVPAERIDALRRAFDETMKDPEFLAEADRLKLDVDPLNGVEVADLVKDLMATPPDVVTRVREALTPH